MYRELVIGFDVREMWLDVDSQWPLRKKKQFLLKYDVVKPLSVNGWVWYSVFTESAPRLWQGYSRKPEYLGEEWDQVFAPGREVSDPGWITPRKIRALDLHQMESYLREQWGITGSRVGLLP
jgi:hypothetical protein